MKIISNYRKIVAGLLSCFVVIFFGIMQAIDAYSATATDQINLTVTVDSTISLGCGADVGLGTLVAGTPIGGSSTCTVTSNSEDGYDLKVKRDDADTTMDKTDEAATNITDKTGWDPASNGDDGNAATWTGTGLGFGVFASTATKSITWWGTGTTFNDANNKYAGFSSTYTTVMDHDAYSATSTTTSVAYRLDVPATQKSGAYSGSITYQVVTKP